MAVVYIKEKKNIKGLDYSNNSVLSLAYADDTAFEWNKMYTRVNQSFW